MNAVNKEKWGLVLIVPLALVVLLLLGNPTGNELTGATSFNEDVCDDGLDNDLDELVDCSDLDCDGKMGPDGEICDYR